MIVTVLYAHSSSEKTGWRHEDAISAREVKGVLRVTTTSGKFNYPLVNVAYWRVEK